MAKLLHGVEWQKTSPALANSAGPNAKRPGLAERKRERAWLVSTSESNRKPRPIQRLARAWSAGKVSRCSVPGLLRV